MMSLLSLRLNDHHWLQWLNNNKYHRNIPPSLNRCRNLKLITNYLWKMPLLLWLHRYHHR